jgi:RNA polymerase sigma-70 factor, ECF subfamily
MGCVGTLSWSDAGLGFGKPKASTVRPAVPTAPKSGNGVSWRKKPALQDRSDAGAGFPGAHSEARPKRGEVRSLNSDSTNPAPLEIDWTLTVRRCLDGDSGAWAELVRTHHRRVYGLCYRFTGSPVDAEDLTQDVFLKIYSNLGSFDCNRGSLQVWITTMTRNLLVDNFRRTKNLRATGSLDEGWNESGEDQGLKPVDRLMSRESSPHEMAARKELEKMIQAALAKVSTELREAVILRDLQDMDYKEIAQVLGIPEGTVKSRISRGRAELARLLERNQREVM